MGFLEKVRIQIQEIGENLKSGHYTFITIDLRDIPEESVFEKDADAFLTFITSSAPISRTDRLKKVISEIPFATFHGLTTTTAVIRVNSRA